MLSFSLSLLLAASAASAQSVIDNLSFGHKGTISENGINIPGWTISGEGHSPQLYSDKVILTPPYGGNKRGALWTQSKSQSKDWVTTLDFRASDNGDGHGKGNMQLWYTKDGEKTVGTASIYTVGRFDGLALVVDINGGVQKIRGFLNDGNVDYKNHANVDSLAFGHCDYNYRNLGRPSKLQVRSTSSGLEVLIEGKPCFSTSKVNLPIDYNFGVTSASSDPPDSFEVFKFEVSTTSSTSFTDSQQPIGQTQENSNDNQRKIIFKSDSGNYLSSDAQFQDLNNRFNGLSKSISNMFTELNQHTKAEEQRYQEILRQLPSSAKIGNLESKLSNLDRLLTELAGELKGGDHKTQFAKISAQLQETNQGLTEHLPGRMRDYVQNHTPRIGFIVFSFMAFQSCCLAVLLWQKWRKSTMPKKFL